MNVDLRISNVATCGKQLVVKSFNLFVCYRSAQYYLHCLISIKTKAPHVLDRKICMKCICNYFLVPINIFMNEIYLFHVRYVQKFSVNECMRNRKTSKFHLIKDFFLLHLEGIWATWTFFSFRRVQMLLTKTFQSSLSLAHLCYYITNALF